MATLGQLVIEIAANSAKFQQGLLEAQSATRRATKSIGDDLGSTLPARTRAASTEMQRFASEGRTAFENVGKGSAPALEAATLMREEFRAVSISMRHAGSTVAGELNPALGETVGVLGSLVGHAGRLGPAMTVATTAVVLAGLGLGKYVAASKDAATHSAALHSAIRGLDFNALRAMIEDASKALGQENEQLKTWSGTIGLAVTNLQRAVGLAAPAPTTRLREASAELDKLLPLERQQVAIQNALAEAKVAQGLLAGRIAAAQEFSDTATFVELNQRLLQAYQDEADAATKLIGLEERLAVAKAAEGGASEKQLDLLREQFQLRRKLIEVEAVPRALNLQRTVELEQFRRALGFQAIPIADIEDAARSEAVGAGIARTAQEMDALQRRMFEMETKFFIGREAAPEPGLTEDVGLREGLAAGVAPDVDTMANAVKALNDASARGRKPLEDYNTTLRTIAAQAAVFGTSFDEISARLDATGQALVELKSQFDPPIAKIAELQAAFNQLKGLSALQQSLQESFGIINSGITGAVGNVMRGTMTMQQAFEDMGRNIAVSLVQQAINQGLVLLERELIKLIIMMVQAGLTSSVSSPLAPGLAGDLMAISPGTGQHGGIVKARPGGKLMIVGEGGQDEAIVPLDRLQAGAGGAGGGDIQVIVNNYGDQPVETRERRAPDGKRIVEVIIGAVRAGCIRDRSTAKCRTFGA